MKYLVAVKYDKSDSNTNKSEIFEFNSLKNRDLFLDDIKSIAKDIALSQVEETE